MAEKKKHAPSGFATGGNPAGSPAAAAGIFERSSTGAKGPAGVNDNLDLLLDIPLEITIELGRTKMLINDLLKLGQGSVIELPKESGDTLDILANNRLVAKGDVVVVNKKYGIRLTEVISPVERVEKLG